MSVRRLMGLLLVLLPALAPAASGRHQTLQELTRASDRVVLAQVLDSRVQTAGGDPRRMTTVTELAVVEEYIGRGPRSVEVVQLGGQSGPWQARVAGDAVFEQSELVLLFLRCPDRDARGRCGLVGLASGKHSVLEGASGGREVLLGGTLEGAPARRPLSSVLLEIRNLHVPSAAARCGVQP